VFAARNVGTSASKAENKDKPVESVRELYASTGQHVKLVKYVVTHVRPSESNIGSDSQYGQRP